MYNWTFTFHKVVRQQIKGRWQVFLHFLYGLSRNTTGQELLKSVYICQSYPKDKTHTVYICQDHENGLTADEVIALTKEAKVFWTTVYLYCKLYSFYIFLFLFIFIFLMNKLCVHYKILSRCMIRPPERKFGRSLCFTSDVSIFLAVILTRQNNFYFLNNTILVFFL